MYVSGKDVVGIIYRKQVTQHFTKFKCFHSTKPSSTRWQMEIPLLCRSVGNLYARSSETVAHGTNFLNTQACLMLCHFFLMDTNIIGTSGQQRNIHPSPIWYWMNLRNYGNFYKYFCKLNSLYPLPLFVSSVSSSSVQLLLIQNVIFFLNPFSLNEA